MAPRLPFSLRKADAHLREADPVLAALIDQFGPYTPRPGRDPYSALVRAILFQQLAGAAARAIDRKWRALYGEDGHTPSPAEVLGTSDEQFRSAGVSRQKAGYLRDLAQHIVDDRLDFAAIGRLPDAEVIARLIDVHGIGEWTAHMFLMFTLHRPDVLPTGDLGVRNAIMRAYGLETPPKPAEMQAIAEPWRPYRTRACLYLWRSLDNAPD